MDDELELVYEIKPCPFKMHDRCTHVYFKNEKGQISGTGITSNEPELANRAWVPSLRKTDDCD